MDPIGLQRVEERLDVRVLVRSPAACRALSHPALRQALAERRAEKLAPPVAVEDQPRPGSTSAERGFDRGPREPRVPDRPQPPGQHTSRALIQNGREIPPP